MSVALAAKRIRKVGLSHNVCGVCEIPRANDQKSHKNDSASGKKRPTELDDSDRNETNFKAGPALTQYWASFGRKRS